MQSHIENFKCNPLEADKEVVDTLAFYSEVIARNINYNRNETIEQFESRKIIRVRVKEDDDILKLLKKYKLEYEHKYMEITANVGMRAYIYLSEQAKKLIPASFTTNEGITHLYGMKINLDKGFYYIGYEDEIVFSSTRQQP